MSTKAERADEARDIVRDLLHPEPEPLADYRVTVLDDGDGVEVAVDCGPVAGEHVARIPLREWEAAYVRARSLQIDMNGRDF